MSTPTNEQRLEQIKARLAAATPGPWQWVEARTLRYLHDAFGSFGVSAPGKKNKHYELNERTEADLTLIANAPADLSWALSRIEELAKDARRLDWLEANARRHATDFDAQVRVEHDEKADRFAFRTWGDMPFDNTGNPSSGCRSYRSSEYTTLREAIDAAMSAASSSGANTP